MERFGVSPQRGFLPSPDPLTLLPAAYKPWEQAARELPRLLAAGRVRPALDGLPVLEVERLADGERDRAMLLLSYFGHAYVWGEEPAANRIPAGVAVPWHAVARSVGRPPVLSYASYALHNWRRLSGEGPIALGNIVLLQDFLGGLDEEWFILVHVEIEARAAPALTAIIDAQAAVARDEAGEAARQLESMASALESMYRTLLRMPERCDPYIYYHRVRPYIHGWKDHPALPDGVIYEGVREWSGRRQKFRGETGAQSSIVPSLDAALGISHRDDPLQPYLMEMRDYMPPQHRAFIRRVESGPSVREYVLARRDDPGLRRAYNECIQSLALFRSKHLEYAALYIQRQSQDSSYNPTQVGTGGTPFMPYLKKHRDETEKHRV